MNYNLNKFINAQKKDFETARYELINGKKESHWMWYMFPQIKGLGKSYFSEYYGIESLDEAKEYYENEYLKKNMNDLIKIILELDCSDPKKVFGSPDDLKLKSSMTLFYLATKDKRFILVLNKFYNGEFDENTIDIIK